MTRLTLILLSVFTLSTHAAVLIEPYGGYTQGTVSQTPTSSGTNTEYNNNGLVYGGRAGFLISHFLILAYEFQQLNTTEKASGQSNMDWRQGTQFATLGFQAPFGLRLMGSYGFKSEADESGTNPSKYTGTAYKLTLGWKLADMIALNAEYSIYKFTDRLQSGTSSSISTNYSKFDQSAMMLTLSFPLTIFNSHRRGQNSN